jgi:hypothetical protein
MDSADFDHQFLVADHPSTRRALRRGLVSSRGDLAAVLGQHATDRLDPELTTHNSLHQVVTMLVDELHERGDGRPRSAMLLCQAAARMAVLGGTIVRFPEVALRCIASVRSAAKTASEIRRRCSRTASVRVLPRAWSFSM